MISEKDIESRMVWYYSRQEPLDLMIEGRIVDAGLPTMFSIYCTLGKWFDPDYGHLRQYFYKL